MAVVADFVGTPLSSGPPSIAVVFTDLSSGSPDRWLWDFGDGNMSNLQNPTHTYTGIAGDKWTVKLTAWVFGAQAQSGGGSVNNQTKLSGWKDGNPLAFSTFQGLSYGSNSQDASIYLIGQNATGDPRKFTYLGGRYDITTVSLATLVDAEVAYVIETQRVCCTDIGPSWDLDAHSGSIQVLVDSSQIATVASGAYDGDFVPTHDISYKAGTGTFSWGHEPIEVALPDPGDSTFAGIQMYAQLMKYTADSIDNKDVEEKVDYVSLGVDAEDVYIDFVGTPLSGTSPLAVQFTDLSFVEHAISVWDFGDGNSATFAGETHPLNTYTADSCSLDLL